MENMMDEWLGFNARLACSTDQRGDTHERQHDHGERDRLDERTCEVTRARCRSHDTAERPQAARVVECGRADSPHARAREIGRGTGRGRACANRCCALFDLARIVRDRLGTAIELLDGEDIDQARALPGGLAAPAKNPRTESCGDSRQFIRILMSSRVAGLVSYGIDIADLYCRAAPIASSMAPIPGICPSNNQPNSNWPSTSRQPRRSASMSHRRSLPAPCGFEAAAGRRARVFPSTSLAPEATATSGDALDLSMPIAARPHAVIRSANAPLVIVTAPDRQHAAGGNLLHQAVLQELGNRFPGNGSFRVSC
jgi:hypothetical protein